jgi:hypothetical protein
MTSLPEGYNSVIREYAEGKIRAAKQMSDEEIARVVDGKINDRGEWIFDEGKVFRMSRGRYIELIFIEGYPLSFPLDKSVLAEGDGINAFVFAPRVSKTGIKSVTYLAKKEQGDFSIHIKALNPEHGRTGGVPPLIFRASMAAQRLQR